MTTKSYPTEQKRPHQLLPPCRHTLSPLRLHKRLLDQLGRPHALVHCRARLLLHRQLPPRAPAPCEQAHAGLVQIDKLKRNRECEPRDEEDGNEQPDKWSAKGNCCDADEASPRTAIFEPEFEGGGLDEGGQA